MMLEMIPWVQVSGESASHQQLASQLMALNPDIIFIDVHLKSINSFAITTALHELFPAAKIIMMTMFPEQGYWVDGKAAGASAVIFKPTIGEKLEVLLSTLFPKENHNGNRFGES
jgi:DNA-binding NarL/FixJ family response regulator